MKYLTLSLQIALTVASWGFVLFCASAAVICLFRGAIDPDLSIFGRM